MSFRTRHILNFLYYWMWIISFVSLALWWPWGARAAAVVGVVLLILSVVLWVSWQVTEPNINGRRTWQRPF